MMLCMRCNTEVPSEAAARRHFAQAHPDEPPPMPQHQVGEALQAGLDGLTRQEQLHVLLLIRRLREGGDESQRLRARIHAALLEAAELAGDHEEVQTLTHAAVRV